jgi:parallel beta-helix repeat protein
MVSHNIYNMRALRIVVEITVLVFLMMGVAGASLLNVEKVIVNNSADSISWKIEDKAKDIFLLENGYAIRIISIDQETFPPRLWLAIEKEEIKIDDAILNYGEEYSYKNDHDEIKLKIEGFAGKENSIVFLKNIYQSSNGEILLNYENSTLYQPDSISSFQVTIDDRVNSNFSIPDEIGIKQATSMGSYAVRQITVDDDGHADYPTIQRAIDAANSGDTIYVRNGTYFEHLLILKDNLMIIGENRESTIIDGGGDGDVIVLMGANNNTIKEITIQNGKTIPVIFPPVSRYTRVFLKENYSLTLNAIDARTSPRQAWLTLSKNGTIIDEIILEEGTFFKEDRTGKLIMSLRVDKIFSGSSSDYILLSNITQYSDKNLNIIVQNEKALLKVGEKDDFVPLNGGIEWGLYDNYALSILDIDNKASPRQTMLLLSKNGAPVDLKIVTTGDMYTFNKSGKLLLRADIEAIFGSPGVYLAKLIHAYQYPESTSGILLNDGTHLYIVGNPRIVKWELFQNYSLTAMDIDSKSFPRLIWFELSKDGVVIEDKILASGNDYSFYKDGSNILSLNVGEIFDGRNSDLAFVSKVYQYSETDAGTVLKQNETHIFRFGNSSGIDWQLYENYTLYFMGVDINIFPAQVWMQMKKNGEVVDDKLIAINQTYSYTNPSSRVIFNGKIDTIFSANLDFLKIINANQYSEIDGMPLILNAVQSFYPNNIANFESLSDKFQIYENYTIVPIDISARTNQRTVWIRLYKKGDMVDEKILKGPENSSDYQNYSYYSGGRMILSAKMGAIFSGATYNMMQFKDFYQYSETDGALLLYIQKKTLAGPRFSKNNAGVTLDGSNGNILQGLRTLNNYYGIYLKNSSINNLIFHNIISNNTINGYDDYSANRWDSGYPSGGNYWSDYTGIDLKGGSNQDQPGIDGIGDTPHYIDGGAGAYDRYPFMISNGWNLPAKGDLNGNGIPADAGDLVLMKRASIGEIQADSRYDLNNNGQNADAGDLVLMKRASIGEITLS